MSSIALPEVFFTSHHSDRLKSIQDWRRRARTQQDNVDLMALPGTVADIEEEIEKVAAALGGPEFRALAGATGQRSNLGLVNTL